MAQIDEFTFEQWAALARRDPAAFEARRRQVIARFLCESGERRATGEALQREIDAVRRQAATPHDALLAITAMLRAQLAFLGEELGALRQDLGVVERARRRLTATGGDEVRRA